MSQEIEVGAGDEERSKAPRAHEVPLNLSFEGSFT